MSRLRYTILWLCSSSLVFVGVLGRGYVLCVGNDGVARIEALGQDGSCAQTAASERPSDRPLGINSPCDGCHDTILADCAARASAEAVDSRLLHAPPVVTWLVTHVFFRTPTASRTPRLNR